MKQINPRLIELMSMMAFAVGMQLILNYITDCDLKALTLMVYTGVYSIWLANRVNRNK